jgi:hypothetical protein
MRRIISLTVFLGLLFGAFAVAEAGITWQSDQFNYAVTNTGNYVNYGTSTFLPFNASNSSTNLQGASGSITDTPTATFNQTGMSMTSGASGSDINGTNSIGATANGYTNAVFSLTNSGAQDPNGLGIAQGSQTVISYIARTLTVDTTGLYNLTGSASAPISFPGVTSPVSASLAYSGAVTLTEYDTAGGGATALNVYSLSLSNLLSGTNQITNITLRPTDSTGNAIYYILQVGLIGNTAGINTLFNNYNMNTFSFLGSLNGTFAAGSQASPITISGVLSPVPVPGSLIVLISGFSSLAILRRKRA